MLTITFDNGPHRDVTPHVLDLLAAHGAPAVFFTIGQRGDSPIGRTLLRRAVAEGHVVGGHTWTHSVPFGVLDDSSVADEIRRTADLVADVGGDALLFRPYGVGGVIDERLMSRFGADLLAQRAMTCALWTCVAGDWLDEHGWVDAAMAAVHRSLLGAHEVLVLHDVPGAALAELDTFLGAARSVGASFVQTFPDACTPIREGRPTDSYPLLGV